MPHVFIGFDTNDLDIYVFQQTLVRNLFISFNHG